MLVRWVTTLVDLSYYLYFHAVSFGKAEVMFLIGLISDPVTLKTACIRFVSLVLKLQIFVSGIVGHFKATIHF